jgi:Glyoxalase-like domain
VRATSVVIGVPHDATIGLVLDCTDPTELTQFWSEALGHTTRWGAGHYVMLVDPDSVRTNLLLQALAEAMAVKNRMHLDIETPDVEDEASRLESLGARRLKSGLRSEHGSNWVIMADPEGSDSASATPDPADPARRTRPPASAPNRSSRASGKSDMIVQRGVAQSTSPESDTVRLRLTESVVNLVVLVSDPVELPLQTCRQAA